MNPVFSPSLHKQRHQFVIDFVKKNKPQTVVDLGCNECKLLKQLKFHRDIELLVGMDINGAKLKKRIHTLAPIPADYLQPSYHQLRVELYQGSVTQKDSRLRGFHLLTSIELIEHLTPPDVERFSEVVFGYMTPLAVIISTPNSEFNPLLPGLTGFRHSDHKFEWTRAEFKSWARKVCLDYSYEVEFTGVGEAPPGLQQSVGFCSQIGVFHRLGGRDNLNVLSSDDSEDIYSHTLLYRIDYPSLRDNNILRQVLVSEVLYCAEKLKRRWMEKSGDVWGDAERGGQECLTASERHMETEEKTDRAEMKNSVEQCGRRVPEDQKRLKEVFWANNKGQLEYCKLCRCVSVPLSVLWSCCPKVNTLSGSLSNLRHHLMEDPNVKLNQDCSAVLVKEQDSEEEEEDHNDLEDSRYAEARQCSQNAEEEDWEASV